MSLFSSSNEQHRTRLYESNQSSIETDSIECPTNSSCTNYNNSYVSFETDDLSALYAHYQIDPQIYPPPDLQLYNRNQQTIYPSQLSRLSNTRRRSRNWRRKQKQQQQQEINNIHHRNMITVRRVSCQDILDSQIIMRKQNNLPQHEKIKKDWNLVENKSQKKKTYSPLVELHTSPTQSTMNKLLISNRNVEKQMSNSIDSKVNDSRDLSASSMASTQLHSPTYNEIKPNATTIIPGSQIDSGSFDDKSPQSSIVPHFSSTIAPYIPLHTPSSTTAISPVVKTESIVANENIQDLSEQLKTCITMLSHLLENKSEHIISNKQSQSSSSLTSTPDHFQFSKKSTSNHNNLVFEDITVKQCNSFTDYQNNLPISYADHHEEFKRCLLIYHRDHNKNLTNNEKPKHSTSTGNHSTFNQYFPSNLNNHLHDLSLSNSTTILTEEDDDYEEFFKK